MIAMDASNFRRWAQLTHGRNDHHREDAKMRRCEDALIAATALIHDLTVATRNTDDFKSFGVALINPFLTPR